MTESDTFYDDLAPFYHLIYPDWEKSIARQGGQLDAVIRELCGDARIVLDVSCGIGTQVLGLTQAGYKVTGSDLSTKEIERARSEASNRDLKISYSVADMREAFDHHDTQYDVVISCDNSVPHLLSDNDILTAFKQMYQCIRPGGGCIITVRDYEKEDLTKQQIKPYGVREERGVRWLAWQIWDPHPPTYDLTMYIVEDRGVSNCETHVMRSVYYAVEIPKLIKLMEGAGFHEVRRIDNGFFQPMIVGTRNA
jgi:SAM-dependent methyltransferase